MRPVFWVPPVLWMAVIIALGSPAFGAEHTGSLLTPLLALVFPGLTALQLASIHGALRTTAHLVEYGVLALLWFRALAHGRGMGHAASAGAAFIIGLSWAALDEAYQATSAVRTGAVRDVALDGLGAAVAAALAWHGVRAVTDVALPVLLWIAAAGGAVLLAINLWTGVTSGILWFTVPAAALVLLVRWHRRRR